MILAKIIGNVVSAAQHKSYDGKKILVAQPINLRGGDSGSSFLAVDAVQAGVGDIVLVAREGNTARQICGDMNAPIHSVVAAIVDEVDLQA